MPLVLCDLDLEDFVPEDEEKGPLPPKKIMECYSPAGPQGF